MNMRAAVMTAPKRVEIVELPLPSPKAGEVRLKLEGCGVCASNLSTWVGMPWTKYPTEPGSLGHEAWGMVESLGRGVKNLKVGDRVAALSYRSYAEFDIAKAENVLRLPDDFSERIFPGESVGCAMNIFRRSEIKKGDQVAIVGIGFLGSLLTRLASLQGAEVTAISRRPFSLDIAKKMGAASTLLMDDHFKILETCRAQTNGKFFDKVIEAVGKQWPLDLSGELTREGGRLIIAGYHQDGPRQVNMQLWNWRGFDVVNAHEREEAIYRRGIEEAVAAISTGRLQPSSLYTHEFPIEKLNQALECTEIKPDGFLKAVITYV
jgi:threonine dehydrogenase-like Zn-dependent dehydrogenase